VAATAIVLAASAGLATISATALAGPAAPDRPAAAPTATATEAPQPLQVTVVGDSLIATTTPDQLAELQGRHYDATVTGNPGKPLTDPWIQARLGEAGGADIVVVATASNDNVQLARRADEVGTERAGAEYVSTLADTLHRVAAPCTVVVDVREQTSPVYRPEAAPTTNAGLRSVVAQSSRPTVVVPWSTVSAGHDRDWFVDDDLHFVAEGQRRDAGVRAYARAIADGVDQCRSLLHA
jgi:hypothetical protein